jgi:cbb3-type cytochrome oxidase subunit 3
MAIIQWLQHHSIVLMMGVFLMILATTWWPGRGTRFDRDSNIPLEDDR